MVPPGWESSLAIVIQERRRLTLGCCFGNIVFIMIINFFIMIIIVFIMIVIVFFLMIIIVFIMIMTMGIGV